MLRDQTERNQENVYLPTMLQITLLAIIKTYYILCTHNPSIPFSRALGSVTYRLPLSFVKALVGLYSNRTS